MRIDLLRELAIITSTLRRKNAGPLRAKRANGRKLTIDDLDF
jgi:hypothetical protein